jgi:ABC-type sugar transport system ATPase subunit
VSAVAAPAAGLVVTDVAKAYGSTHALRRLAFSATGGRITGIAGPNGAGKSTFVGILGGEISADRGTISIGGRVIDPGSVRERVAVVHQEPLLFPNLTVWENIIVGREESNWWRPGLPERIGELLDAFALTPYRDAEVGGLPLAAQQRVEIVRALARSVEVLVFDEPNSALSEAESAELFQYMHKLADEGRVVLLISHRIGELVEHCESVVMILDGEDRAVLQGDTLTEQSVAACMIDGAESRSTDERRTHRDDAAAAENFALSWRPDGSASAVDIAIRAGEVTAFIGVEGSGARAFVQALGTAPLGSRMLSFAKAVGDKVERRIEFVPAHRQESLFPNFSIAENIASRLGPEISGLAGLVAPRKVGRVAETARTTMRIKVGAMHDPISTLSGGNQQKVAIAAAIARNPRLLVLEEPTRGVDLGSRAEIYRTLAEYAATGRAVCLYCTEVVEVFRAAHRAIVFRDGRIAADLNVADVEDVRQLSHRIVDVEWA